MSASLPFAAVIFDCDGVLVASERLINDLEARLLGDLGLSLSPAEVRARFKGHTVAEVVTIIESLLRERLPADWLYEWGMQTALAFSRDLRAIPGVRAVLDALTSSDIPLGVVSQAPLARVELALSLTQLAPYFDERVFTASMVPRAKPCPDPFLFAAARMGVSPARCAVIEDSPSGAEAAVAAGMTAFGYAGDEDAVALAAAGATVFDDMAQLAGLLGAASPPHDEDSTACDRLREAYGRFFQGDPRALGEFLADDVVYHLPGRHLGGGTLRGWKEILKRTASAAQSCDDPPAMRLVNVVAGRDVLLSVERIAARRHGRVLDQQVCVVWRMADERCVEVWSMFADPRACDRFWQDL